MATSKNQVFQPAEGGLENLIFMAALNFKNFLMG